MCPFNAEQIAYAGNHSLDFYLKNEPIDQINVARPLIEFLMAGKKEYVGAKQYVTEQLRYQNDSSFMSYFGDQQVTYGRKRTLEQASYEWGSFHDGFGLNEDELAQAGITFADDKSASPTASEKIALSDLLKENQETLRLGFQEGFDLMAHRDGTQSATDIAGIDALISLTPSAGTVGGIAGSNAWWQNYDDENIDTPTVSLADRMEIAWRRCIRVGGQAPDKILAGSDFIDAYRTDAKTEGQGISRTVQLGGPTGNKTAATLDAGIGSGTSTGLYFKGVEIHWDPVFENLDAEDSPTETWEKRCYFINSRHLKLRPIKGHWLIPRRPPRVYDRYVHYWGLTAKAAITTGKRNAHAVLSIA